MHRTCADGRFINLNLFSVTILQHVFKFNILHFMSCNFTRFIYEGGSICNENPFITQSTNALGFDVICQMKAKSVAVIMVHETLFYLSKCNMLQAF